MKKSHGKYLSLFQNPVSDHLITTAVFMSKLNSGLLAKSKEDNSSIKMIRGLHFLKSCMEYFILLYKRFGIDQFEESDYPLFIAFWGSFRNVSMCIVIV